jgi:hypothetical protein
MPDYNKVYSQDNPVGDAHGWIQWKGTDVCIDLHCQCGAHGHVDGMFCYYYKCEACGVVYALGQNVKLIPLDAADTAEVLADGGCLFSDPELRPSDDSAKEGA